MSATVYRVRLDEMPTSKLRRLCDRMLEALGLTDWTVEVHVYPRDFPGAEAAVVADEDDKAATVWLPRAHTKDLAHELGHLRIEADGLTFPGVEMEEREADRLGRKAERAVRG
ncbi:MAG: hypothetical protein JRL30_00830 [Deltaproteobacteria bacterium]|nr:hypothetical protein [Deltaproteobacteria bacterium]